MPGYILDISKTWYQPWRANSPLGKQWYKLIVTIIHCNKFCNNKLTKRVWTLPKKKGRLREVSQKTFDLKWILKDAIQLEMVKNEGTHSDNLGSILALLFISCATWACCFHFFIHKMGLNIILTSKTGYELYKIIKSLALCTKQYNLILLWHYHWWVGVCQLQKVKGTKSIRHIWEKVNVQPVENFNLNNATTSFKMPS